MTADFCTTILIRLKPQLWCRSRGNLPCGPFADNAFSFQLIDFGLGQAQFGEYFVVVLPE